MLGDATKKYESGNLGPEAISHDPNDPGGASYGTYQLSYNTGTLMYFLREMGYERDFAGLRPGYIDFDHKWHEMCQNPDFVNAQWKYIKITHFDPAREYATSVSIMETPAIDEAIWSMAVQHGRVKQIIQDAIDGYIDNLKDETDTIDGLYSARCDYVDKIGMSYLKHRYDQEVEDILALVKDK